MVKMKEWHLRREQGVWCVYHVPNYVRVYGGSLSAKYSRVASSRNLQRAIELGKRYAVDLAKMC